MSTSTRSLRRSPDTTPESVRSIVVYEHILHPRGSWLPTPAGHRCWADAMERNPNVCASRRDPGPPENSGGDMVDDDYLSRLDSSRTQTNILLHVVPAEIRDVAASVPADLCLSVATDLYNTRVRAPAPSGSACLTISKDSTTSAASPAPEARPDARWHRSRGNRTRLRARRRQGLVGCVPGAHRGPVPPLPGCSRAATVRRSRRTVD